MLLTNTRLGRNEQYFLFLFFKLTNKVLLTTRRQDFRNINLEFYAQSTSMAISGRVFVMSNTRNNYDFRMSDRDSA